MLGFVDKDKMQLDLYSTSNMWPVLYVGGEVGEVVLQPGFTKKSDDEVKMPEPTEVDTWPEGMKNQKRWTVPLGPPIVTISIDDVENEDRIEELRSILLGPLQMEQDNITYRRLQVHYSKWPHRFSTNSRNRFVYGLFYAANPVLGTNTEAQLRSLAPIIATLAFNFKTQGRMDELDKLKGVAGIMPRGAELDMLRKDVPELFE
jgi:hypothetical protein